LEDFFHLLVSFFQGWVFLLSWARKNSVILLSQNGRYLFLHSVIDSNISLLNFIEVYSNISPKHFLLSHLAIGSFCQYLLPLGQNPPRASHEALKELSIASGEISGELCRSSIKANLNEPQFRKETWYQHGSTMDA
jgi:hypothetical protein